MYILRGKRIITGGGSGIKPAAPAVIANDSANTLLFTSSLAMEISVANAAWVNYNGAVINTGDNNFSIGNWRCRVKAAGANPASDITYSPAFTQSGSVPTYDFDKYFDVMFYGEDATAVGGGSLVNGAVIASIPARKGGIIAAYTGAASPSLGRPYWLNDSIVYRNDSEVHFTGGAGGSYPPPQELTCVIRKMPGTDWEAISNDTYIGLGGGKIRVITNGGYVEFDGAPEDFTVSVIHVKITRPGGGDRIGQAWLNGVNLGVATVSGGWNRSDYMLGVTTNSADYDLFAKFYKNGLMTDIERTDCLSQLNSRFDAGALPTLPYASNITKSQAGNNYTANYTYNGVLPENVGAVQYQWYELVNNGAFTHVPLGTTKTITYNGSNDIRPTVKVFDNQGNTWRYVNGLYFN